MTQNLRIRFQPTSLRIIVLRSVIVMCAVGYFLSKHLQGILLPHGPPVREPLVRDLSVPWLTSRAEITKSHQDILRFHHGRTYKIRAEGIVGPETIAIMGDRVFCLTDTAKLLELTNLPTMQQEKELLRLSSTPNLDIDNKYVWNATSVLKKNLGIGRPLGARFYANTLYIADAALGLTQLRNVDNPASNVELLSNHVTVLKKSIHRKENTSSYTPIRSPLLFVNSVAVGPVTKKIYFTDSSDIPPDRIWKKDHYEWDILYASKMHLARGKPTGRLCEYDPTTGITRILADGIHFANGIAVDPIHEDYVIVSESMGVHILKYNLHSVKKTTKLLTPEQYLQPELLATSLPGYPDNVDCAVVSGQITATKCFVGIVAEVATVHMAWTYMPYFVSKLLRTVIMALPRSLLPELPSRYTGILIVDPLTGEKVYIQDPSGQDLTRLTGATVSTNHGKLYLGSLHNDYVGVHLLSGENQGSQSSVKTSRSAEKEEL